MHGNEGSITRSNSGGPIIRSGVGEETGSINAVVRLSVAQRARSVPGQEQPLEVLLLCCSRQVLPTSTA
jgi:hypothetical protein